MPHRADTMRTVPGSALRHRRCLGRPQGPALRRSFSLKRPLGAVLPFTRTNRICRNAVCPFIGRFQPVFCTNHARTTKRAVKALQREAEAGEVRYRGMRQHRRAAVAQSDNTLSAETRTARVRRHGQKQLRITAARKGRGVSPTPMRRKKRGRGANPSLVDQIYDVRAANDLAVGMLQTVSPGRPCQSCRAAQTDRQPERAQARAPEQAQGQVPQRAAEWRQRNPRAWRTAGRTGRSSAHRP